MFFVKKIDTKNFTQKNKVGGKNSTIMITTITIFRISVVFAIFAILFGSVYFFWGQGGVGWQDVKNSTGRGQFDQEFKDC